MSKTQEDAFVGRTVRLILIPLLAVIVPILLYVASSVHGLTAQVQDSSLMIAEIHAEMRGVDRRVNALETDAQACKDRVRDCENEVARIVGLH